MKNFILVLVIFAFVASLFAGTSHPQTLTLRWLPGSGHDQGCGVTEKELNKAVRTLTKSLKQTGMGVQLGRIAGAAEPSPSPTGLWIDGVPLETWLNAEIATPAEGAESDCPQMKVGTESYTKIPADLIVKAGLAAAEKLSAARPVEAVPAVATQGASGTTCSAK